jgi:hypothetical protein
VASVLLPLRAVIPGRCATPGLATTCAVRITVGRLLQYAPVRCQYGYAVSPAKAETRALEYQRRTYVRVRQAFSTKGDADPNGLKDEEVRTRSGN